MKPKVVIYCPGKFNLIKLLIILACTFPLEFCQYGSKYEQCKIWLAENYPEYLKNNELPEKKEGFN